MAQSLALPAERLAPVRRRIDARRVMRDYSFAFGLILAIGLLIANIAHRVRRLRAHQPACRRRAAGDRRAGEHAGNHRRRLRHLDLAADLLHSTASSSSGWLLPGSPARSRSRSCSGSGARSACFTGLLIVFLRVQPVVVTLAMYFILQGVDLVLSPQPQALPGNGGWTTHLAGSIGPIPGAVFTIGLPLLIWIGLRFVPFRRYLYAVGSNETTAFSSGVNVTAVRVASYALGGLFAGIAGARADRSRQHHERATVHRVHAFGDRGRGSRRDLARRRAWRADRARSTGHSRSICCRTCSPRFRSTPRTWRSSTAERS